MESGKYRAPLGMPALHESLEFGRGSGIDSGEWLVEHNQARILGNQPGEQHALHLPAGKRTDGAVLKAYNAFERAVYDDLAQADAT